MDMDTDDDTLNGIILQNTASQDDDTTIDWEAVLHHFTDAQSPSDTPQTTPLPSSSPCQTSGFSY